MDWVGDDRITCADCARYDGENYEYRSRDEVTILCGRCKAARPPMTAVPDLLRRCEYFNARPDAEDQRKGIERWPELKGFPGGPARNPYPAREEK